ncbi:hypothetical protein EH31_11075 [Erythrobacter longus]|uniref:Uncharacterized protein n=1 Tax=Erythrobacter longus TaxID=1044 RepID=A0A074MVS0_ERYLO|nr:hypothetical protein EH31_11075 [Erythrobacter longus]
MRFPSKRRARESISGAAMVANCRALLDRNQRQEVIALNFSQKPSRFDIYQMRRGILCLGMRAQHNILWFGGAIRGRATVGRKSDYDT